MFHSDSPALRRSRRARVAMMCRSENEVRGTVQIGEEEADRGDAIVNIGTIAVVAECLLINLASFLILPVR